MFFAKDELEIRKLVILYSICTSVYFTLLLLILYWTNGVYLVGKYQFSTVIIFIAILEVSKYLTSAFYLKIYDVNLSKKYEKTTASIFKNIFSKTKIKEGIKNIIVVCLMIFLYAVISMLYGAEVFSKHEETLMFSFLLSVLTVFPACTNLGSYSVTALVLGNKPVNKLEELIHQNFFFTLIGSWLGAFVIPLDWDRPWQEWPIPCSFGAMVGYTLSHFIMMFKVQTLSKRKAKKV